MNQDLHVLLVVLSNGEPVLVLHVHGQMISGGEDVIQFQIQMISGGEERVLI